MIASIVLDDNHKPSVPWEVARWACTGCHNCDSYDGPPVNQRDEKGERK